MPRNAEKAEAWDEGYAAAYNDERESMPDHTKNPYRPPMTPPRRRSKE